MTAVRHALDLLHVSVTGKPGKHNIYMARTLPVNAAALLQEVMADIPKWMFHSTVFVQGLTASLGRVIYRGKIKAKQSRNEHSDNSMA